MNQRIQKLRHESFSTTPSISIERALLETEFYQQEAGKESTPILRARCFYHLCAHKSIYIGEQELIVGERGPAPKAVPTFPELTCHSAEDLQTLNDRKMTSYKVAKEDISRYQEEVIPYWRGRSMRDRIFAEVPENWKNAYEAGLFTEFMEQRAPGHTALDGTIYRRGLLEQKERIAQAIEKLDFANDPEATDKREQLQAMAISCDAAILFAKRHADYAKELAKKSDSPTRQAELLEIAEICQHVPAHAPRTFYEAIQMYWFCHLGCITELNGWDAMTPGHIDQHLTPFYERELAAGTIDRERAKELIAALWIKINNHSAPPKVGVTAKESGTYNDFTQINLGGLSPDGGDASSELSYLLLEVSDELHLLQPQPSLHISQQTPDALLHKALEVIRKGYGYPSLFNSDGIVLQQVRVGKSVQDAREGGTSGCIETGAFGKEAYILTGYLNLPKILEITLNNGVDPLTGKQVGLATGDALNFTSFKELYHAFRRQLSHIIDLKIRMNNYIERMYAKYSPAPFLSVLIHDCIEKGKDYYDGGPRYNTNYIQCCGIGTITDSLSALQQQFTQKKGIKALCKALHNNWRGEEIFREEIRKTTPFYGNDENKADSLMQMVYDDLFELIDGRKNSKGSFYHLNMLSTTCHVYFGTKVGASPDGRYAGQPISDGTSPAHGADQCGPTAVIKSLSKMDQSRSGGTLLNQRFLPSALEKEEDLINLGHLVRSYFTMGGHHIQFNIVDSKTLRDAQQHPDQYSDLLVRVAGYSDYFVDLDHAHQQEIINRTEHSTT